MKYTIALQTVIDVPGYPKELGYTLFHPALVFDDHNAAMASLSEVGLPLGWVVISFQGLGLP